MGECGGCGIFKWGVWRNKKKKKVELGLGKGGCCL